MPKPKPRKRYNKNAKGVYVHPIDGDPRKGHLIRWKDPRTDQKRKKTLPGMSRPDADKIADELREMRRRYARENLMREALGLSTNSIQIETVVHEYYDKLAKAKNASPYTLSSAERYLTAFLRWCQSMEYVLLRELNQRTLKGFYIWCTHQRKKNGETYRVSTINQWLKPVRAALNDAGEDLLISPAAMKKALPHTPIRKKEDRELHGVETSRCLEPQEIPLLLQAVRAFDARPAEVRGQSRRKRTAPAIVDVILALLYGPRIGELTKAKCGDILIAQSGSVFWTLRGKGRRNRRVDSDNFTRVGPELLRLIKRERKPDEWVSENEYETLGWILSELPKYGGPVCTMHDLRATCATYHLPLGLASYLCAERMGHTIATQEGHYLHPHPDMPRRAKSIEDAMGIADIVRDVIAERWLHAEQHRAPRATDRKGHRVKVSGLKGKLAMPPGKPKKQPKPKKRGLAAAAEAA